MRKSTFVLIFLCSFNALVKGQASLSQQPADLHFQSGLDLISHQQLGAAYDAFSKFQMVRSARDPRAAEAQYYLAYCSVTLLHADGERQLEEFTAQYPIHPRAITAYYDLALFFYSEKNYAKASAYFAKVDFPSLSEEQQQIGRFRWGYSFFSLRNLLGALDQFNSIKSLGGQYGPASSYYAGFIELSVGDYENALLDFKRAEKSESYATIVPPLIATTYQKQGRVDDLLAYAEPLLDREDIASTDELSLLTAEAWFKKGEYKKALPRYEAYLENHENANRSVFYRAGYSAWSAENDGFALACLKKAASDADSVGMYSSYLLGTIYLKRGEKPLALTAFETSKKFEQDPRMAEESLFLSAKINYELGRPDVAIQEFESILIIYPQSSHAVEIKELLSQAYVNANNFNKAIAYIESLPRRTPAVDRAYQKATFLKGTELYNKEDYALAAASFEKSLEFSLDGKITAEASYWLGETYSIGRKYEQAVPHYEHALAPGSITNELTASIRYGLGYAHYNLQQYDKALVSFKEYASKGTGHVNYADGLLRLADCQYVLKSFAEALASYRKVIQLKSIDAEYAHLQSGVILGIQRHYAEAEAELELVARNSGSKYSEEALFQMGQQDIELGKYSAAVNHFTMVINTAKTSRFVPYALTRRATANFNLKNYSQTANDYITVVEKFPAHSAAQDLLLPLQEALRLSNRAGEFDKYLASFKKANPDAKGIEGVEFESAKNYYFNQNYPKAIETLSAFGRNYPESRNKAEAAYYEAESYYRLKDFSRSLEIHKQISADPELQLLNKVIARVAELEFRLKHYELAAIAFNRLARIATNKKEEYTALNGLMESYFLLGQYDSTNVYAKKIQVLGGVSASAQNKASLYLGKTAKARGDYDTAKDEFVATFNAAQDEYGAEAKYLLAEIFFLTGDHKGCFETLISLNHDFELYQDWVGKSFLLLADNYVATDEIFQAKGTLKSLIENFPNQEVRDIAKTKLNAIEQKELKKAEESKRDTTDHKE